ncbi:helix-turn-helix transcriptional regulator [Nocardioides panacis]|uniref:Helix-turn-helix transcriptional regulator n=1 Tax=Nocardioides panacis TaxID=2849501 RepID=A0A975Y1V6_9ACTN|nr:helix-turn-helix transcriptional regulator [Nocardioides panacis]QWZ09799.1 helix-turn-helix transcriptional regulator [Nocardioides panacis]
MDDSTREPVEVRELRALADSVRAALGEPSRRTSRDLQHWRGLDANLDALDGIERTTTRSVWNMQPRIQFDPEDPAPGAGGSSEARGVETVLITRPATLDVNPLLPSIHPDARVGPVFLRGVVLDEERVVIEGLDTADGEPTAWLTDRPHLVVLMLELWHRTLALSAPVLAPGQQPLLSPRRLRVARLLAMGEKDQAIARQLEMSGRTVEREVRAVLEALGARSRTEAVLAMSGRASNSRTRPTR